MTEADAAEMVAEPALSVVASPFPSTVAKVASEVDHVTPVVSGFMLPSEKVPVAVNCCVKPAATEALPGVTEIDCRVGVAGIDDEGEEFEFPPPHELNHDTANIMAS